MSSDNSNSNSFDSTGEAARIREEIKYLNINICSLRQEIPRIVNGAVNKAVNEVIQKYLKELRKPKPYFEVGYQG